MTLFRAQTRHRLEPLAAEGQFSSPYKDRMRAPLDTPSMVHLISDDWFESKFQTRYRARGVICSGDIEIARGYMKPHKELIEIAPIGDYRLCFSPNCKDLFGVFQFRLLTESDRKNSELIYSVLDNIGYIELRNEGLEVVAATGHEAMIVCDQFHYKLVRK
jgi:hypothetical protein